MSGVLGDAVLCSGTLGRIPYPEKIAAAAAAGFAGVSIYHRESDRPNVIRRALGDAGLFLAELDGPMNWLPAQPGPPAPSPMEMVDRAVELGARSITVVEISGQTPPLDQAVHAFARVCELAAPAGVLVHIEPFPWSGISDFGYAADIVTGAGCLNGGVLLDTWHLLRGPNRGQLPDRLDPKSVLGLQINDVLWSPGEDVAYEAMHQRMLPGAGAAAEDVRRLLHDLRAAGCAAPLEVEVFSDELSQLPSHEAARRCSAALQQLVA